MASDSSLGKLPPGIEIHGSKLRIVFYVNGKRYRESLGLPPTKQNISFAKLKRESILYEVKIGTFQYAQHFPNSKNAFGKPHSMALNELVRLYLEAKEHDVRSSTFTRYKWVLEDFLDLYGRNRSCNTLSPRSLVEYRKKLVAGKAARTINRNLVTIKSFLSWLHKMEYMNRDLSIVLERVKENEADIQPFSMEEVNKALEVCHQLQHKNMITVLVYTGLRSGELCALAWEDVDFQNRTIHVRRSTYDKRGLKTTKTDKERFVDLMPPAYEALKSQRTLSYLMPAKEHLVELRDKTFRKEKLRFVFNPNSVRVQKNSDYDYYGKRALGNIWRSVCKKSGVEYRNQYQLRHTYASWMITHANINVSYLANQMGHSDITMVAKVYGKWLTESNKKESDRVWEALRNVIEQ